MHGEVLFVLILISFDTYMMVPIEETLQSPTMEEPSSAYLNDGTVPNIPPRRCGFRDGEFNIENSRRKRHISGISVPGKQYESTNLTYEVILDSRDRPSWFNEETVMNEIKAAFEYWSRESSLEFTYWPYGPVDITITFTLNEFACEDGKRATFGKPGDILGCTRNPPDGNVYLDITEDWTIEGFRGTNIFQVATHEIGHALGLHHSKNDASVMLEKYPGNRKYLRTAPDDIRTIRALGYGSRKGREVIDENSLVFEMYRSPRPIKLIDALNHCNSRSLLLKLLCKKN